MENLHSIRSVKGTNQKATNPILIKDLKSIINKIDDIKQPEKKKFRDSNVYYPKISKNKYYLMLEIKPLFSKLNLIKLLKEIKNLKQYSITSFKEKNLIDINKINKKINKEKKINKK